MNLRGMIVALLGVALCLPFAGMAQEKEPDQFTAVVLTLERKRDVSIPDFEAALKKHLDFRLAEGEGRYYQVYTPVEAGDYFKYYVRYCCVTLAEQDAADKHLYSSDIVTSYKKTLAPILENLSYQQQWIDRENSTWTWPNTDDVRMVGVTTWSVNPAKAIQMNKARARLSQLAKEKGKPNKWAWFITVGGEETLNLAIPFSSNAERGEVQSFADFAARHIGKEKAEALAQQFTDGFWRKEFTMLSYRPDFSVEKKEGKKAN